MHLEGLRRRIGLPTSMHVYALQRAFGRALTAPIENGDHADGCFVTLRQRPGLEEQLRPVLEELAPRYPELAFELRPSGDQLTLWISGTPNARKILSHWLGPRRPLPPVPVVRALVGAASLARLVTAPLRALPSFLIIGAPRSGTTSLYAQLIRHPRVVPAQKKEIHYLNYLYRGSLLPYRSFFPTRAALRKKGGPQGVPCITGEASPTYLYSGPQLAARVRAQIPGVKIIGLLRNPVDRAYSHHYWAVRRGGERTSFEEAIAREMDEFADEREKVRADPSYASAAWMFNCPLQMGIYAEAVADWTGAFPPDQVLFLRSEDLYSPTSGAYSKVLRFLGLPETTTDMKEHLNSASAPPMDPGTRERLEAWFEPHNARLRQLTDIPDGWNRAAPR